MHCPTSCELRASAFDRPAYDAPVKSSHTPSPDRDPTASFRHHLQRELARRCSDNRQYSLRALALDLDVDHATLSQLLRNKRRMTAETIRRLGGRLGLPPERLDAFVAGERCSEANTPESSEIRSLATDAAHVVSDVLHFALLELVRLDCFQPDARWIARVLDVSVDEVQIALQRLIHLGLLEMESAERWIDRSGHAVANVDDLAEAAVERLYEQVRRLASRAVRAIPRGYRDQSSTTIAIRTARLPEAIERIGRFRREIVQLLEQDSERDDVYQLEIHFFPVTKLKDKENE